MDSYIPDSGVEEILTKTTGTTVTYAITETDQTLYTFDETGKIISRTTPEGASWTYTYDGYGWLDKIEADGGSRYLDFSHDPLGYLTGISDHTNRSVSYTQDTDGNLASVTDVLGHTWTYEYNDTHQLLRVVDPDLNQVVRNEYEQVIEYDPFILDFTNLSRSYYSNDFGDNTVAVEDEGRTFHIIGHASYIFEFPYKLTSNTILEFDYKSNEEGFWQGIGFDDNWTNVSENWRCMQLWGTTVFGNTTYKDYHDYTPDWKHYIIPIGTHYTGQEKYLVLYNDDGDDPYTADSFFRDVKVYESTGINPIIFNSEMLIDMTSQTTTHTMAIEDEGKTLHLTGNAWKSMSVNYNLTPNTVIEFDFKSDAQGEVHGVGFDTDRVLEEPRTFNLYGTQTYGIEDYKNYEPSVSDWKHFIIPVGRYYTGFNINVYFGNDHDDVTPPTAASYFSNVQIYENDRKIVKQFDGEENLVVSLAYNQDGTTTLLDAYGNPSTDTYNENGMLAISENATGLETVNTHDENFKITTITNAADQTLTMDWSDDGNNLLSETDPAGNTTAYTYDELNNRTSETDPLGNVTTYTYDGTLLTSKTDKHGNTTHYTYTAEGNLESTTDSLGHTTSYTYNTHGQKTSVTDWRNHVTTYVYDALDRLVDTIDPRGRITHTEYDAAGHVLRTISNYDPGLPQNFENQYNITTAYEYDVRGNKISSTNSLGRITRSEYDAADRLVRTINPAGNFTTNTYNAKGQLVSTTDALGRVTSYTYDAAGRRLATIDALGISSGTTIYDIAANSATTTDVMGNSATFYYDSMNRVIRVVDPLGNETLTTYDTMGNVSTHTDALGRITRYEYDNLNRLVRNIDPIGGITQTVYDEDGNRSATIDPLGHQTTYIYDTQKRLIDTIDPMGNHTTNTYDDDGRLIATTNALGQTNHTEYDEWGQRTASIDVAGQRTTYTYDLLNRTISTTDPTGTATTTYDPLGKTITRTDVHGRTTTSTYDELGRVIESTDFNGNVTYQVYDAVGNLVSSNDAMGNVTTHTYDALNRLVATTNPLGNQTRQIYDELGKLTDVIDASGVITHTEYDALQRPVAIIRNYLPAYAPTESINVRTEFTYNEVSNRIAVVDPNGQATTFTYDAMNRVTGKADPLGNTWQYSYDLAGNRISMIDGNDAVIGFNYDANDQLILIDYPAPDHDVSFTYDALGRRVTMTDGLGTTTWEYDSLGQLIAVTDPNNRTVTYSYDTHGNRTQLVYPDGRTVSYTYDPNNRLTQVADWDNQTTEYSYDPLGQLLSVLRPNDVDTSYAYDAAGQLTALENSSSVGSLSSYEYAYDQVGNRIQAEENLGGFSSSSGPTVIVTVIESTGIALSGIPVYAFNENTYSGYSKTTDTNGQISITLPAGEYRFRADVGGTQFWSATSNHCTVGICGSVLITVPEAMQVAVADTSGNPAAGLPVYVFNGTTYTGYHGTTGEEGNVSLRLPVGEYRFRADFNGTQFWSSPENHCPVPGCTLASVTVTLPITLNVLDDMGMPKSGLKVYAFNNNTYTGFNQTSDVNGQAFFTLPLGDYRFRADLNGTQFWSASENHCSLPGCFSATIMVTTPILVTVMNTDGIPAVGLKVYAFNGTTYTGYNKTTDVIGQAVFTMPQGSYRFRADLNGTQFWSGIENHCTLPGCLNAEVIVTKPLTVTVEDGSGTPQTGVKIYAFTGTTYTGYSRTTDVSGQAVFTLPQGEYRFRADVNGTQYWSGAENHCMLPGCESVLVVAGVAYLPD
ncbi:MAG: hypothetical protein JW704_07960, partial [Anaerolineaceae bacterium]|nr:hypothetical protein [Anaerolineaceae bacterium]